VCLRVARPDIENAKITAIDKNVSNATTKANAKSIQKIKSKSNNKKNPTNTYILGISDSSDSESDK
jgi:hypothetical protein